jgi:hypothetical protein
MQVLCDEMLPQWGGDLASIQTFSRTCVMECAHYRALHVMAVLDIQQVEDYNCGVFSLMFFELHLHELPGDKHDDEAAATFFRYRYLAHGLSSSGK